MFCGRLWCTGRLSIWLKAQSYNRPSHGNAGGGQGSDTGLGRLAGHDLTAVRPGVNVAVRASHVAELAEIDLEHLDSQSPKRVQPGFGQRGLEMLVPRPWPWPENDELFRRVGRRVAFPGECYG